MAVVPMRMFHNWSGKGWPLWGKMAEVSNWFDWTLALINTISGGLSQIGAISRSSCCCMLQFAFWPVTPTLGCQTERNWTGDLSLPPGGPSLPRFASGRG